MFTDALGRTFDFDTPPRRVISLVPSLTEVLFDLGCGEKVVGVTDFCIFPEAALKKRQVGGTKNPKVEVIRELEPDLVYMNLEENLKRHAEAIEQFAPVFVTEPRNVPDVEALILKLAAIHGKIERGDVLVQKLASVLADLRSAPKRSFTFAVPIWKNPWMSCGGDTYVSNLVSEAGGVNACGDALRYPALPLEELLRDRKPEVIFLPDEPYLFTPDDAAEIRQLSPECKVIGPFPGHLFTWHGTRTIAGLQFLQRELSQR